MNTTTSHSRVKGTSSADRMFGWCLCSSTVRSGYSILGIPINQSDIRIWNSDCINPVSAASFCYGGCVIQQALTPARKLFRSPYRNLSVLVLKNTENYEVFAILGTLKMYILENVVTKCPHLSQKEGNKEMAEYPKLEGPHKDHRVQLCCDGTCIVTWNMST